MFASKFQRKHIQPVLQVVFLAAVSWMLLFMNVLNQVYAVATTGYLRTDRMSATTNTGGTICLTSQTASTESKVLVTFPATGTTADATHYGVNATAGNWTVTTTNIPTGATAWPGIGTATNVTGGVVTFPSTDLTVGVLYCFNFSGTNTLSTPTAAATNLRGSIQTQTAGSVVVDTVNFATSVITNDQVVITGTVASTFTMTLGSNTAAIGALTTTGAPSTASVVMTVSTNANNGWLAWIKNTGANSTLTSATTGDTSISSGAYTTGAGNVHSLSSAAGYGVSAAATAGTPTISTEYTGSATTFGSLDSTKFEQFASKSAPVSGSQVTLTFGAEATATTKAATDYTDTVTITAAGQF